MTSQNKAQLEQTIEQQRDLIEQLRGELDATGSALGATQAERDEAVMERQLLQASLLDPNWKRTEEKPMRLRILELPIAVDQESGRSWTPFVFVVDRVPDDREIYPDQIDLDQAGASGVFVFKHEVQLGEDLPSVELSPPATFRQSAGQPLPAELQPSGPVVYGGGGGGMSSRATVGFYDLKAD